MKFNSAEHYVQWQKLVLFKDLPAASAMLKSKSPKDARKMGGSIKQFNQKIWATKRLGIVKESILAKFAYPSNMELLRKARSSLDNQTGSAYF